jgi:hypothetical protein
VPSANTTAVVDSASTPGSVLPLAYGYVWATGRRAAYFEVQNTGIISLDFTRVGFWILGEGEWDGCHELWINDQLIWTSEWDDPTQFHFHRGCDAPLGAGLYPNSSGPDQNCDSFWGWFPAGTQPFCFSRMAYYGLFRKQWVQNPTSNQQDDPSNFADLNPIGLWRATKVRIFDDQGNQTGYAFSTNPVWQLVDLRLRRKLFPEYNIDLNNGIDPVPSAVLSHFSWGDIWNTAQYCDQLLANGRRRFEFSGAFSSQTTRTAIQEQILKTFRGFTKRYGAAWSVLCDMPRSSVFTITREHVMPGTFQVNTKAVAKAPNHYVGQFRDLLVPVCANIASITCADHQNPILNTATPHPLAQGDRIAIGGTDTIYDGQWTVASVPAGSYVTQATLQSKGSNYPANVGAGGSVGLLQARFEKRSPTFMHESSQLARGAVGVGLPRYLNRVPVTLDLATSTFDQVSRICRYERDKALGPDVTPYVEPPAISVRVPLFAVDAAGSGATAAQLEPGDLVTIDEFASFAYQGVYEVLDPDEADTAPAGLPGLTFEIDASSGTKGLTLGTYAGPYMYDTTDPNTASYSNVPGSDPGNDSQYTSIDLADNGKLAFLTGSAASGAVFDLPSTGFSPQNLLAIASPQGYIEKGHDMHVIALCDVDANREVTLNYEDGEGNIWNGDANIAAVTWLGDSTAASTETDASGITWLLLQLAGGEDICIGTGVLADSTQISLPSGYVWSQAFAVASPHDGIPNGNQASGFGAYVDSTGIAHCVFQDSSGNSWTTNLKFLVFAWKNNSGAVTTQATGGANWMNYTTSTGFVLGVGLGTFANGATIGLPSTAAAADSLQIFSTVHSFTPESNPAHGVGACYVDANLVAHCYFEDGEGHTWGANLDAFMLYYEPTGASGTSAGGITVSVSPASVTVPLSGSQQFAAFVSGSSNTAVNWSVDGVAGGNATVGTIDGTGLYTAPANAGSHVITATSQANAGAVGTQYITVGTGSATGGSGSASILVTPLSPSIALGATEQFTATVSGLSSSAVTWLVDGIAGGSASTGTIDANGLYTAPSATASHTVTAQSQASPSVAGSATVYVGQSSSTSTGGGGGTSSIRPVLV